jgi:starvation-inducible DNA-binding protein
MHRTKNDLAENKRKGLVELLNARLVDAIDLRLQCKQAHWNVKGVNFIALHKLFDEIAQEVDEFADLLAERAVALGGNAEGTVRAAAKNSKLPEFPTNLNDWSSVVDTLSTSLAAFGKLARQAIDQSDELGDKDTADVFTEISRGIDKSLWFVEAHLQGTK